MYNIEFSKTAEKQLYKLGSDIRARIISTLERCRIRPHHYVKRLVGMPYHKLRIGDYRAILDIKNDKLLILVIEIGHRKDIYK